MEIQKSFINILKLENVSVLYYELRMNPAFGYMKNPLLNKNLVLTLMLALLLKRGRSWHCISTNMPRIVTVEENISLTSCVTPQEISNTIFRVDISKAPALMDLVQVFLKNISLLLEMILGVAFWIFSGSKLFTKVNHTLIALVPKVDNPT